MFNPRVLQSDEIICCVVECKTQAFTSNIFIVSLGLTIKSKKQVPYVNFAFYPAPQIVFSATIYNINTS